MQLSLVGALVLVSQTSVGDGIVHTNAGGKDNELNMHLEIAADFEKVLFGELTQQTGSMTIGTITVTTNTNVTMVMTTGAGSASMVNHMISRSAVTGQPPQNQEHCIKCEVEHERAPADIKECLSALAAGLKPSMTKGDFDGYSEVMQHEGSTSNATLFVDKDGLLQEISSETDVKVPGQPDSKISFDVPLKPTAGAPDFSRFAVDPAWKCDAPPTGAACPAPPPDAAPQLLQVYKCFVSAMDRAQAREVVV